MAGPSTVFREIHHLRSLLNDLQENLDGLPRTRKARLARLAKAEGDLASLVESIKNLKVTASSKEKSLKAKHELIAKHEQQLSSLVSKKEYDAKKLEIAFAQAEISKLEEEAFAAIEEGEALAPKVPDAEKAAVAARAELQAFDADMEGRKSLWEKEAAAAKAKLAETETQVLPGSRQAFEKTVAMMGHDGFAEVDGRNCGGCQGELTMQHRVTLESGNFLMCPNCGRILYLPGK